MRTKTLILAAALTAAGIASSMAQSNVYSLNVVGYVNKVYTGDAVTGQFSALANPLNTTNNTLQGVLSSLPSGASVLKWNGVDDYNVYDKAGANWFEGANNANNVSFSPGEGALLYLFNANITNTYVGEVKQGNLTNSYVGGFNLTADQVPEAGLVTSIQLTNVPSGSSLMQWSYPIQDFIVYDVAGGNWFLGATPATPSVSVAESFFIYNAGGNFNWVRNFTVQ